MTSKYAVRRTLRTLNEGISITYMNEKFRTAVEMRRQRGDVCAATGCGRPLTNIGKLCGNHGRALQRQGHPTTKGITKGQLKPYRERASIFLSEQQGHPGVKAAVEWLDGMIAAQTFSPPPHLRRKYPTAVRTAIYLNRLRDHEVTGFSVLATMIGLYLYQARDPKRFPIDDGTFIRFQVGRTVLKLAPVPTVRKTQRGTVVTADEAIPFGVCLTVANALLTPLGSFVVKCVSQIQAQDYGPTIPHLDTPF